MESTALSKLRQMLEFGGLIEQSQTMGLISASKRQEYFALLNDKTHKEIESILGQRA